MQSFVRIGVISWLVFIAGAVTLTGCDKMPEAPAKTPNAPSPKPDVHDHTPGDGHAHGDGHDHGPVTQLGEQTVGGYAVKASRDGGITPGSDAPIDVWVTGGAARISAVRFWIGTQDAKGSVKAKAELEKDNWHSHVEIPKPMPQGGKLWVEIETDKGEKHVAGFDLKA